MSKTAINTNLIGLRTPKSAINKKTAAKISTIPNIFTSIFRLKTKTLN